MPVEPPMKIAFLGAPGAGKTRLARKVIRMLNKLPEAPGGNWTIVDGYVDDLTKTTGLPFGADSNFPQNLSVLGKRWMEEVGQTYRGNSTITCGSLYETVIYSTFITLNDMETESEIVSRNAFNQLMMQTLGALEVSTYDYDAIFYLPWSADRRSLEHSWDAVVDAKLPEVLDGFSKVYFTLDQKTQKAKADRVIDVIGKIYEYYHEIAASNNE